MKPDKPSIAPRRSGGGKDPLGIIGSIAFGDYIVRESIGGGGFAEVYKCEHKDSQGEFIAGKFFALTQLPVDLRRETVLKAYWNAAEVLKKLDHPNIIRIIDYRENSVFSPRLGEALPGIAMDYVGGPTLVEVIRDPSLLPAPLKQQFPLAGNEFLPLKLVLKVVRTLFQVLAYCHQSEKVRNRGTVIHRDVKPSNIMFDTDGTVFLLDFDIAKEGDGTTIVNARTDAYASPEQMEGKPATIYSDIFSLGLVLFEMLVGGAKRLGIAEGQHLRDLEHFPDVKAYRRDPENEEDRALFHNLAEIAQWCAQRAKADRYRSAENVVADLERAAQGYPPSHFPPPPSLLPVTWRQILRARVRGRPRRLALVEKISAVVVGVLLIAFSATVGRYISSPFWNLYREVRDDFATFRQVRENTLFVGWLDDLPGGKRWKTDLCQFVDRSHELPEEIPSLSLLQTLFRVSGCLRMKLLILGLERKVKVQPFEGAVHPVPKKGEKEGTAFVVELEAANGLPLNAIERISAHLLQEGSSPVQLNVTRTPGAYCIALGRPIYDPEKNYTLVLECSPSKSYAASATKTIDLSRMIQMVRQEIDLLPIVPAPAPAERTLVPSKGTPTFTPKRPTSTLTTPSLTPTTPMRTPPTLSSTSTSTPKARTSTPTTPSSIAVGSTPTPTEPTPTRTSEKPTPTPPAPSPTSPSTPKAPTSTPTPTPIVPTPTSTEAAPTPTPITPTPTPDIRIAPSPTAIPTSTRTPVPTETPPNTPSTAAAEERVIAIPNSDAVIVMVSIEATGPSAAGAAHSFWIGKFEVTHHQWVAVMGPASVRADRDTWPVYNVSFREAVEFAARVNRLTGKSFRLPTEEEWTQACAGQPVNAGTAFFGNADLGHPQFVGTLSPNNRRLYDMYGNVWEFCLDLDKGQPPIGYDTILERIRNNRETGTRQNLKGGGFNSDQTQCYGTIPVSSYEERGISYGLRLAHDAPLTR